MVVMAVAINKSATQLMEAEIPTVVALQILLQIRQEDVRAITDIALITTRQAVHIPAPILLRQLRPVRSIPMPTHPANAHAITAMW